MSNTILFCQISPTWVNNCCAADAVLQPDTTLNEAEWFFASATDYILGTTNAFFTLYFGNLVLDPEGNAQFWSKIGNDSVELTAEEFANWGTDDGPILNLLASKLELEILQTRPVEIGALIFR